MSASKSPAAFFDREVAANHDERFLKLAVMKDCLHLIARLAFAALPERSRILCVGIGTGAELLYLADAFPAFEFVAIDPSVPMLEICRERVAAAGIAGRVTFHEGYLDTLPESPPFDAATCLLVSQFLVNVQERRALFQQIAARLMSDGRLLSADLAAGATGESFEPLFDLWKQAWRHADVPERQIENIRNSFGRDVAVLPANDIEELIASAGFEPPVQIFQAVLVHAWLTLRNSKSRA